MDWNKLIHDLNKSGMSQKEIAEAVGTSQPIISDLSRGLQKTVLYETGAKLVALHKQVTKQAEPA